MRTIKHNRSQLQIPDSDTRLSHERLTVETGQALKKRLFRALLPPCIPVVKGTLMENQQGAPSTLGMIREGKGAEYVWRFHVEQSRSPLRARWPNRSEG